MTREINVKNGDKFYKLTIIKEAVKLNGKRRSFMCQCECGRITHVLLTSILSGHTRSCGCLKGGRKTHGMRGNPIYRIWNLMIQRCENKNNPAYSRYGGRGIKVADEWHVFENFFADMGWRPTNKTLDRIDNNGSYCKENCRWASSAEQANNKRNNHSIEWSGAKNTLSQWSRKTGIKQETIRMRLKSGWSIEKTLTIAVGRL